MAQQRLNSLQDLGKALKDDGSAKDKKSQKNANPPKGKKKTPRKQPRDPARDSALDAAQDAAHSPMPDPAHQVAPLPLADDETELFAGAMAHVAPLSGKSRAKLDKGSLADRDSRHSERAGGASFSRDRSAFTLEQGTDLEELKKDLAGRKKQKKRDRIAQFTAALEPEGQEAANDPASSAPIAPNASPDTASPSTTSPRTASPSTTSPRTASPSTASPSTSTSVPDDQSEVVFARAMAGVQPLGEGGREVEGATTPAVPVATDASAQVRIRLRELVEGDVEFDLEDTKEYVQGHVKGLDPRTMNLLKAGNISHEAHLDLHGLNTMQAYETLVDFMKKRYMESRRCVLLIPGRGRNSPEGVGVLREKLQSWLTRDPFRRVVLAFCTAQPKHGGAGALYVLLRRFKKSRGKVHWDRYPTDPDLY